MVKEKQMAELPKRAFLTDDEKFVVTVKGTTLEAFEDKLCAKKLKENPALKDCVIDKWLFHKVKANDFGKSYPRAEWLEAVDKFKVHLFNAYL